MSIPLTLSNEIIEELIEEFRAELSKRKSPDSKINFTRLIKKVCDEDEIRPTLIIQDIPLAKIYALVQSFDKEVAWHGVVERYDSTFIITDIVVYPQTVSGVTVNTDQKEYQNWLYDFDDETFNNIRFQGHSHVNMGVSPSATDLTHQDKIVNQLAKDDYYIFGIFNKKLESTFKIYDLSTNTLYEDEDIDVYWAGVSFNRDEFIKEAKALVKEEKSTTTYYQNKPKKNTNWYDDPSWWTTYDSK